MSRNVPDSNYFKKNNLTQYSKISTKKMIAHNSLGLEPSYAKMPLVQVLEPLYVGE